MQASGTLVSPTSIAEIDSAVERSQSKALDKSPWLSDYKRASDLIPSSLLPENQSTLLYTRAYRYTSNRFRMPMPVLML